MQFKEQDEPFDDDGTPRNVNKFGDSPKGGNNYMRRIQQ